MRIYKGTITEPDQIENLLRMCDSDKTWMVLSEKMREPWVKEYPK
jgi:hypothetical protein